MSGSPFRGHPALHNGAFGMWAKWFILPGAIAWALAHFIAGIEPPLKAALTGDLSRMELEPVQFTDEKGVVLEGCVAGLRYPIRLTLQNPTDQAMLVTGLVKDCGCLGLDVPDGGLAIRPGESFLHSGFVSVNGGMEDKTWEVRYQIAEPERGEIVIPVRATKIGKVIELTVNGVTAFRHGVARVDSPTGALAVTLRHIDLDPSQVAFHFRVNDERYDLEPAPGPSKEGEMVFRWPGGAWSQETRSPIDATLILEHHEGKGGFQEYRVLISLGSAVESP